jgi:2,3-bisphosphoglycerate-independent phosphoglycerate mutase
MKKLLLFFIDGIGLGEDDERINPIRGLFSNLMAGERLVKHAAPLFFPQCVLMPTDPVMGVAGVPQSATGQTSIFTGVNAQRLIGYHLTGYPNERLKAVIEERSLMKALIQRGVSATAANLYSQEFFEKRRQSSRNLFPVSTLTIQASGAGFRYWEDYKVGQAVFADITNELIRSRGYDIKLIKPQTAAAHMLNILGDFDFVFFEYFMTDLYGHKRNREELIGCVETLNQFTEFLWKGVDRQCTSVLVVSDHGNAEDLRTGDHTSNMVPTLLLSEDRDNQRLFAESVKDLTDIYGAVLEYFKAD